MDQIQTHPLTDKGARIQRLCLLRINKVKAFALIDIVALIKELRNNVIHRLMKLVTVTKIKNRFSFELGFNGCGKRGPLILGDCEVASEIEERSVFGFSLFPIGVKEGEGGSCGSIFKGVVFLSNKHDLERIWDLIVRDVRKKVPRLFHYNAPWENNGKIRSYEGRSMKNLTNQG